MTWLQSFYTEVEKATDEQLKLWLKYMKLFKDDENNVSIDSKKRERYREIIYGEMKKRGLRRERSRERGKAKN